MKLKNKIPIVIILIMVCATFIYWGVFRAVIIKSFEDVESLKAEQAVTRCVATIDGELRHLERIANDWGSWDDSYEFALTHSPGFIEKNLVRETFADLKVDLIHVYDTRGEVIWKKTFDPVSGKEIPLDLSLELKPAVFSRLVQQKDPRLSATGIIRTRYGSIIVASRPILTSHDRGPSRGTFIMGRFLSAGVLSTVSRQEGFTLRVWPVGGDRPPRWVSSEGRSPTPGNSVGLYRDKDIIHAYTVLNDLSGKPAALLEALIPRTIMKAGLRAYHTGMFLIIAVGCILLITISGMLKIMVLKPILNLKRNVLTVKGSRYDISSFETSRKDEVGTLSREFASMIQRVSDSEEIFRFLAENARDAIWMLDLDLKVVYMSPAIEKITGVSAADTVNKSIRDILTPDSYAEVMKVYDKESIIEMGSLNCLDLAATMDLELRRKDGSGVWTEIKMNALYDEKGGITGIMGIARDISERREKEKIEKRLIQNQKMEALGRFAGGIAHDMNNILYPIIINCETLLQGYEPGTERHQIASQILNSAYRQRNLVRQILSFSRKDDQKLKPIRMTPVIQETLGFLRSSLPTTIRIVQRLGAAADTVIGDPTQVQQVIMNLCRNAADAMESQTGTIEVVLENAYLEPVQAGPEMVPGRYIVLKVRDDGSGIPPDLMGRIFEPFFTTKGSGKGNGMGLAVVHGIVNSIGGTVTVESEPGKETLFSIYLPVYGEEKMLPVPQKEKDLPARSGVPAGIKGRILLVDDEEFILSSLKRALDRSGYEVTTLTDGTKALELLSEDPDRFDIVITDQTMPEMTGAQLAVKILEILPDLPVIISTGFSEVITEEEARGIGVREVLLKPVSIGELNSAIRRVLRNSREGSSTAAEPVRSVSPS